MKQFTLVALMLASFAGSPVFAATNYVVRGGSVQDGINVSQAGDVLVIEAGPYPANLVFSRPITVLRAATNADLIQLQGTVTIQGTGSLNFAQCQFLNNVDAQCDGATLSFSQCQFAKPVSTRGATVLLGQSASGTEFTVDLTSGTGTNLQAYDSSFATNGLKVTGGKATLKRCSLSWLTLLAGTAFEGLRITNISPVSASAPVGAGPPFVLVQSQMSDAVTLMNYRVWIAYNYFSSYDSTPKLRLTGCDSVLIGNRYDSHYAPLGFIYIDGGSAKAYNNLVTVLFQIYGGNYAFYMRSNAAELVNNTIWMPTIQDRGLYAYYPSAPIQVRANIIYNAPGYPGIEVIGPQPVHVTYSLLRQGGDNVLYANCFWEDSPFEGTYIPRTGSRCIGGGPPDPVYYNRGTSNVNDVGYTGGPYYNPANWTNDNPMVFWLSGSPLTVFKGQQTNIQVNVGVSAGH